MRVVDDEDLGDQHLIGELRKEYGMTYNDFFMVLTDVDLRVKVQVLAGGDVMKLWCPLVNGFTRCIIQHILYHSSWVLK